MFPIFTAYRHHYLAGCIAALLICAGITLLSTLLVNFFDPLNIVMLYLLGVVFVAFYFGKLSASFAAVINVISFDYFFVIPHFSFAVNDLQYIFTFIVMLLVGLLIGFLTAKARTEAQKAQRGEAQARTLFAMANELSAALTVKDVLRIAEQFIAGSLNHVPEIYLCDDENHLFLVQDKALQSDYAVAALSFSMRKKAGCGVELFYEKPLQYIPLATPSRILGILVIELDSARLSLLPEQEQLIDTQALLIASALERIVLAAETGLAKLHNEKEKLRNTILAALSHDLRTPITVLFAQSELLVQSLAQTNENVLAQANKLRFQVSHISRLVSNLLDMARLESEGIHLRKEWQSMQEMIGGALATMKIQLEEHPLTVSVPADLPLVFCDAVLIERVIVNLLENGCKYAGENEALGIDVTTDAEGIKTTIWNNGPSLAAGKETEIFEKFSRGVKESPISGVGLGLAICKTIIETHGGRIWAENRVPTGVSFHFTLPVQALPDLEPELAETS